MVSTARQNTPLVLIIIRFGFPIDVFQYTKPSHRMYNQYDVTTAFVCSVYVFVIIFGSIGNGFLVHCYLTDKSIRQKPFKYLVTNLAGADFIICALFTPLLLIYRAKSAAALIAITPLCESSIFLSMLAISMMYFVFPLLAFHRNDVALRPGNPYFSISRCRKLVAFSWLLSALTSAGIVLVARREFQNESIPKLYRCILVNTQLDNLSWAFLSFSASLYGVSVIVTAIAHIITPAPTVEISVEARPVSKLCVWVPVCYTLCWTPFLLVQLVGIFGTYTEVLFNLHAFSSAVGVCVSAITPVLYTTTDPFYMAKAYLLLYGKPRARVDKSE